MDFLKNTKNGRILPYTPALARIGHMVPCDAPVVDVPEVKAEEKPDVVGGADAFLDYDAMTRVDLIQLAKTMGLPVNARMSKAEVVALFPKNEASDFPTALYAEDEPKE